MLDPETAKQLEGGTTPPPQLDLSADEKEEVTLRVTADMLQCVITILGYVETVVPFVLVPKGTPPDGGYIHLEKGSEEYERVIREALALQNSIAMTIGSPMRLAAYRIAAEDLRRVTMEYLGKRMFGRMFPELKDLFDKLTKEGK